MTPMAMPAKVNAGIESTLDGCCTVIATPSRDGLRSLALRDYCNSPALYAGYWESQIVLPPDLSRRTTMGLVHVTV